MSRSSMLAATVLAVAGLATGSAAAATTDAAQVADLVVRSARWLSRTPGFAELRDSAYAPRLLREVMRLALVRSRGEAEVVGRVLDAVPVAPEETALELANRLIRRAEALPHHQRVEFLGLVGRVASDEGRAHVRHRTVEAMFADGAPPSPFTPQGDTGSARVATDRELEVLAQDILSSLQVATDRTRQEPGDLPLNVVADRLLDE